MKWVYFGLKKKKKRHFCLLRNLSYLFALNILQDCIIVTQVMRLEFKWAVDLIVCVSTTTKQLCTSYIASLIFLPCNMSVTVYIKQHEKML